MPSHLPFHKKMAPRRSTLGKPHGHLDDVQPFNRDPSTSIRLETERRWKDTSGWRGPKRLISALFRKYYLSSRKVIPDFFSEDDIVIAIMGPTGAGKSTFIRCLTGEELTVGHNLHSCTSEVLCVKTLHPDGSQRQLILIDTPGFDDTSRADVEILESIAKSLTTSYVDGFKLSGVLYFTRISDNRMTGTAVRNLKMFQHFCGEDSLKNVILVTTMWSTVQDAEGTEREEQLMGEYWKEFIDSGAQTARYNDTKEGGIAIINKLTTVPKTILEIQRELVIERKQILETKAGVALAEDLVELAAKQNEELQAVNEEHERAEREQHENMKKVMAEVKADYEKRLAEARESLNQLRSMRSPASSIGRIWSS